MPLRAVRDSDLNARSVYSHRLITLLGAVDARADDAKPAPEPRLSSIHPFSGSIGTSYSAVIRGRNLKGANGIEIAGEGVRARVLRVKRRAG